MRSRKHLKRSISSPITSGGPISELIMMNNIDDLPDLLLVEILCRLPCVSAVQCKCVSKHWLGLISDPYFIGRFLYLQHDKGSPKVRTTPNYPALMESCDFSLSFLPCFKDGVPAVLATYNDLVLCCAKQSDYYICNPYTKHWVPLPPTRRVHEEVEVGFLCDPYYNCSNSKQQQRQCSSSSTRSICNINGEYRWKVVRIVRNSSTDSDPLGFDVEMFSSETREWRDLAVLCSSQPLPFNYFPSSGSGVAYNGMLYWLDRKNGFTLELDPSSTNASGDNIAKCRFIEPPLQDLWLYKLGVPGGCLRMCPRLFTKSNSPISVWELKEDDGKLNKWCLVGNQVSMDQMLSKDPLIDILNYKGFYVLSFHPNNKDIIYLQFFNLRDKIIMCNLSGRTLEIATQIPFVQGNDGFWRCFNLWWPTPVPRL